MRTQDGDGIRVPAALAASLRDNFGTAGERWCAALPALAAEYLDRWDLRPDEGPARHGVVALVLPVLCRDGSAAALKLQPVDEETRDEPRALAAWRGRGAVDLLRADPEAGVLLLQRLAGASSLESVPDDLAALRILAALLADLVAVPAPPGLRQLDAVADDLLARFPAASARLAAPEERTLLASCAAAVRELRGQPSGDRLLHWDLHYGNVLALPPGEGPGWRAIDPKPLAGHPGFDLLPALWNRWREVATSNDPARALLRRFDLLTDALVLDRAEAAGWTLGRVLQASLWYLESGTEHRLAQAPALIAHTLLRSRSGPANKSAEPRPARGARNCAAKDHGAAPGT